MSVTPLDSSRPPGWQPLRYTELTVYVAGHACLSSAAEKVGPSAAMIASSLSSSALHVPLSPPNTSADHLQTVRTPW